MSPVIRAQMETGWRALSLLNVRIPKSYKLRSHAPLQFPPRRKEFLVLIKTKLWMYVGSPPGMLVADIV